MGAFQRVRNAFNALRGRQASPVQRAHATGHVPNYPVSNAYEELNHYTSWNYVGVHTIAKQWAQAKPCVYDASREMQQKALGGSEPQDQRKPLKDHPALKLLSRPNPVQGRGEFLYLVACQQHLTGGYVIWEVLNQIGLPIELWVLPRAWLSYQMPQEGYPLGLWRVHNPRGITGYFRHNDLAGGFYVDLRDTIIGGWPNPLYPGEWVSPLAACAKVVDVSEKAEEAVWASLINAPRPGMVLSVDPAVMLTEDQQTQFVAEVEKLKAGSHNAGKIMLMQGVKTEQIGTSTADLDAVNVRGQNQEFSLTVQGVPREATGSSSGGTYSGNAATLNSFVELTVQPALTMFGDKLSQRWKRYWGDDFDVEFEARRYDDPTLDLQRADKLIAMVGQQLAAPNEARAAMQLPPIPGGDEIRQPMVQPVMPGDPNAAPPPGGEFDLAAGMDEGDESPEFDLSADLGDEETTGQRNPLMQAASGNRLPFSTNGSH